MKPQSNTSAQSPSSTGSTHSTQATTDAGQPNAAGGTKPPFVRNPHNYDVKAASEESSHKSFSPSLTVQSMSEDADINIMMTRMGVTGKMPDPPPQLPSYVDYEGVFDFRTAIERVQNAQDLFMSYPASLRGRFENNPQLFLEFCTNPENKDELKRLGLAKPEEPPPPLSRDTEAIIDAVKGPRGAPGDKPPGTT